MRIVVNDIAASNGGALTVLKDFYNYLIDSKDSNEWFFLLSDNYVKETDNIKVIILENTKKNWFNRFMFDFITGKKLIEALKPDVVFSLQNTITFGLKLPQVIYVHQSIPFQSIKKFSFLKPSEQKFAVYQYLIGSIIKTSIKKADSIIVQTNWIKESIMKSTKIDTKKIFNILPNGDDLSRYKKAESFNNNQFFYPAAEYIYKNHQCIYQANSILNKKGIYQFNVSLTLPPKKKRNNITMLGELDFKQIIDKYNSSTLIFPSYIETLGLPLIEASQLNSIILASDCSFSREVLEGYENAYYFDPFQPQELALLMEKVISGEILKKEKTVKSLNSTNSWEKIKEIIIDSIKNKQN